VTSSAERFGDDFGAERMWGLKELAYPDPVPFLPLTPGWWVLAAVLFLFACYLFWWAKQHRQRNAYRRSGIAHLRHLSASKDNLDQLPFILRKAALVAYPRADVASLSGEAWRQWLNQSAGREVFSEAQASMLDVLAYQSGGNSRVAAADADRLLHAGISWMRLHRA